MTGHLHGRRWQAARARRLGAHVSALLLGAAALAAVTMAAPAPALAAATPQACGSGVEARYCPPLCSKLLPPSSVSRIFHVPFGKADWHVDGMPGDVCTWTELKASGSTVSAEVDGGESPAGYAHQVKVAREFDTSAKAVRLPALGRYAVDLARCIGSGPSAMCYPNVVVYSKGFLVQAGEALDGVSLAKMDKTYVPEIEAWVKALLARA